MVVKQAAKRTAEKKKQLKKFEGESTRSALDFRFDLMPREALEALARRLALGAKRHGENNWKAGGREFERATVNHLMAHLLDYIVNGNRLEANTDAILCNAAFLCYFEAQREREKQTAEQLAAGAFAIPLQLVADLKRISDRKRRGK